MACTGTYFNGIMNLELERRKEFERRKKLRLLQVRQQSKEFADKLRERIKGEIIQHKTKYLEAENKLKQEKHLQELCHLKELYDKCLESIGEGHKEAAKQPNLNLEKQAELSKHSARASKRGTKAIKKHIEDGAIHKQKIEAPVKQKKATRKKENLRAFFISSLPKHDENYGPHSISPPKTPHHSRESQETRRVLEEIPSNLADCELSLQDSQKQNSPEKISVLRKDSKGQAKEQSRKHRFPEVVVPANNPEVCLSNSSSPKDCSCDYIVCSCHKSPGELRRSSSESRLGSERVLDFEEPRKKKLRSRSCSSVRTLNYFDCGNVYESVQQSCVRVTHHSRSPKRTEEEPVFKNTVEEVLVSKHSIEELRKKTDERGAKALRKEQLKRDFQQLIQNLKKLTQEKCVISSKTKGKLRIFSSERDILTRNETKQKKLNNAFEKLPHSLKSSNTQNTGIQKPNQIPIEDSSPPTLNLALCQTDMSMPRGRGLGRRAISTDEMTVSTRPRSAQSSSKGRSGSPSVLVDRDPSGDVHITVKVSEILDEKSKPKPNPKPKMQPSSSDTSYMSPPSNLTPSQQQLLRALEAQVNKRAIGQEMKKYIKKLLQMSRESVDDLRHASRPRQATRLPHATSPQGTRSPESQPSSPDLNIEQDLVRLDELAVIYAEKVNTLVGMYEQMSSPSTSPYIDPIRAPPRDSPGSSCDPTPSSMRSTSPRPRQGICPPAVGASATPCPSSGRPRQGICPPADGASATPCPSSGRPRDTPTSSGSACSADDTMEMMFGGIPGVPVPTREELDARMAQAACMPPAASPPPANWDMEAFFNEKRDKILRAAGAEEPFSTRSSPCPGSVRSGGVSGGASGGGQEGWGNPDTNFDTSALQFPLNLEKLNAVRQKLANICNDQYREILEELQNDTSTDQHELENILKQAVSDPFLDPNATLAPLSPVQDCSAGSEWAFPREISRPGSPSNLGFSGTGRTPPADQRLQTGPRDQGLDSSGASGSTGRSSSEPRDTSNIKNLLLLAKSQDRLKSS